jgi:hypothetical protein
MIAFVGVCVGWETHDDENHSLFGVVGTACVTDCMGDTEVRNFFLGNEDHFRSGDVSKRTFVNLLCLPVRIVRKLIYAILICVEIGHWAHYAS